MSTDEKLQQRLDQATRARLAKLADIDVDTSTVEQKLSAMIQEQLPESRSVLAKIGPSIRSIAAVVVIGVIIALVIFNTGNAPVVASAAEMTRVHREVVAGTDAILVGNYEQAANAILAQWTDAPTIPRPTVGQITSCCLHKMQRKEVACIAMEYLGQVVTMAVGHSRELVCSVDHTTLQRNGKTYLVHQGDDLQMVMIEHSGRWVCLMSQLTIDDLITLADGLQF